MQVRPRVSAQPSRLPAVTNVHYITVLDDVVLAFKTQRAARPRVSFRPSFQQLIPMDSFGTDKMLLQVGVDGAGGLDGARIARDSPSPAFVFSNREERDQSQQLVSFS